MRKHRLSLITESPTRPP